MESNITNQERYTLKTIRDYYWKHYRGAGAEQIELLDKLIELYPLPKGWKPNTCVDCGQEIDEREVLLCDNCGETKQGVIILKK